MSDETGPGKGRPTRSRKDAEAERKKAMKSPSTRKEQMKRDRSNRASLRRKQQEALRTGDDAYLPPRDRGPVRALVRDVVDRRFNLAEFLLPILLAVIAINLLNSSVFRNPRIDSTLMIIWLTLILLTILDEFRLVATVRRNVTERYGLDARRGTSMYAILRSTQLRRFRLPRPQIKRGGELRQRY